MRDTEFKRTNKVFSGNSVVQKSKSLDTSSSHRPIGSAYLDQIFENYLVPHWENDPKCLQLKVYLDIMFFLGKRGVEGLREMKKSIFVSKLNPQGREYLELTYNESTKKSDGTDNNPYNDHHIILSQPVCQMSSTQL